jgi:hypothetical protein
MAIAMSEISGRFNVLAVVRLVSVLIHSLLVSV